MDKIIKTEKNNYKLCEDFGDSFDEELFLSKFTDYFENYDYIVGDIAYGKIRLKGFNKKNNKYFNKINDFSNIKDYIKNNCAYGCGYFILEKID